MSHSRDFSPPYLDAYSVDRVSHRRRDADWTADRLKNADARFIPVWRSRNLFTEEEAPRPVLLAPHDMEDLIERAESVTLLGEQGGLVYFAVDLPSEESSLTAGVSKFGCFRDLRKPGALLELPEGALLAYARAVTYWHRRHRFCGDCGSPTVSAEAGHLRVCTNERCKQQHFPRTDPAVIVLVTSGDHCLLGRQSVWPKGMYSAIAGFVEPGESPESTVMREVREETGIRVAQVRYHSSQPWPFPASLMLGFTARAVSEEIRLRDNELEDARWLSFREIEKALHNEGEIRLPSNASIARRLVEDWFHGFPLIGG